MSQPHDVGLRGNAGYSSNNFLIKADSGFWTTYVNQDHPTIFRPFPNVLPDGTFGQVRLSLADNDAGPWLASVWIARQVGDKQPVTFIVRTRSSDSSRPTPFDMLVQTVTVATKAAVKRGESFPWTYLTIAIPGKGKYLNRAQEMGLIQGATLSSQGKNYRNRPQLRRVICLPKTAMDSLRKLLNIRSDRVAERKTYAEEFACGEFTHPAAGRVIVVRIKQATTEQTDDSESTFIRYEVVLGDPAPIPEIKIRENWLPWDDVLQFPTDEQQMGIMAGAFRIELLRWAFQGTGLLTPSMMGAAVVDMTSRQPQPAPLTPEGAPQMYPPPGVSAPADRVWRGVVPPGSAGAADNPNVVHPTLTGVAPAAPAVAPLTYPPVTPSVAAPADRPSWVGPVQTPVAPGPVVTTPMYPPQSIPGSTGAVDNPSIGRPISMVVPPATNLAGNAPAQGQTIDWDKAETAAPEEAAAAGSDIAAPTEWPGAGPADTPSGTSGDAAVRSAIVDFEARRKKLKEKK